MPAAGAPETIAYNYYFWPRMHAHISLGLHKRLHTNISFGLGCMQTTLEGFQERCVANVHPCAFPLARALFLPISIYPPLNLSHYFFTYTYTILHTFTIIQLHVHIHVHLHGNRPLHPHLD